MTTKKITSTLKPLEYSYIHYLSVLLGCSIPQAIRILIRTTMAQDSAYISLCQEAIANEKE